MSAHTMNAGVAWQEQKDEHVRAALEGQPRAKKASTRVWIALIIFLVLVTIWELHSLLQH